jgi:hypothetical protein
MTVKPRRRLAFTALYQRKIVNMFNLHRGWVKIKWSYIREEKTSRKWPNNWPNSLKLSKHSWMRMKLTRRYKIN